MAALRLQATALCLLALVLCASAQGGYYGRRLSQANGFAGRELLGYYSGSSHHRRLAAYYGGHPHRLLQEFTSVRPLFSAPFVTGGRASATDVPLPHFLTRQLKASGYYGSGQRRLAAYYGSHRRLSAYYGGHRRLSAYYGSH